MMTFSTRKATGEIEILLKQLAVEDGSRCHVAGREQADKRGVYVTARGKRNISKLYEATHALLGMISPWLEHIHRLHMGLFIQFKSVFNRAIAAEFLNISTETMRSETISKYKRQDKIIDT